MNNKLKCIMLVDDSSDDNFFNERERLKSNLINTVITKLTGNRRVRLREIKWSFVSDFVTKPLTKEVMQKIAFKYFNDDSI